MHRAFGNGREISRRPSRMSRDIFRGLACITPPPRRRPPRSTPTPARNTSIRSVPATALASPLIPRIPPPPLPPPAETCREIGRGPFETGPRTMSWPLRHPDAHPPLPETPNASEPATAASVPTHSRARNPQPKKTRASLVVVAAAWLGARARRRMGNGEDDPTLLGHRAKR